MATEIRICPKCGENIGSYASDPPVCPYCGWRFFMSLRPRSGILHNGHGYILVPFFTAWNYSRCYLSGFKKEKRRGDFFNIFFHLKMLL